MSIMQINRSTLAALGSIIAGRPDIMSDPDPRISGGSSGSGMMQGLGKYLDWFRAVAVPSLRLNEMKYYDRLEVEIPEVRKCLDALATMAVTGNLTGGGRSTYTIRLVNDDKDYPEELKARLRSMEVLLCKHAYPCVRGMIKYGSYMPEVVVGRMTDGKLGVIKLRHIPPSTLYRNIKETGESDPNAYWVQVVNGNLGSAQGMSYTGSYQNQGIAQWRLPHFAVWTNVVDATQTLLYGTSLLQPVGPIALKVHAGLDAIMVARLSRAAMRYKWKIDVSDIVKDQGAIKRRCRDWQRMNSRSGNLLGGTSGSGQESYQHPMVPDEDIFVPAGKGLDWDLDTVEGDTNLARVGDLELLIKFYFGALGVPPEYIGHDRSQGGRSSLSQIDIHFARTVRHLQMFAVSGFEHIVLVDMLLAGWDPIKYPIQVIPPPIGARDELLQAQVRALCSTVLANLRAAGFNLEVNPRWVMETFLGLDEELGDLTPEEIKKFISALPEASAAPPGAQKRINDALQNVNAELTTAVRESFRLMVRPDQTERSIFGSHGPEIQELAVEIAKQVDIIGAATGK